MPRPFRLFVLAAVALPLAACGGSPSPRTPQAQMRFGVRMAERGLWSEAWFRFEQARMLGGENDPEVINNLAVAAEALGRFDQALELYRRALELAPANRELKHNYDRFVGFYESYRVQADAEAAAVPAAVASPPEPPADFGSPAESSPAEGSPAPEPTPSGPATTQPPPVPVPEPPVPPPQPSDSGEPSPDPDGIRDSGGLHHG